MYGGLTDKINEMCSEFFKELVDDSFFLHCSTFCAAHFGKKIFCFFCLFIYLVSLGDKGAYEIKCILILLLLNIEKV